MTTPEERFRWDVMTPPAEVDALIRATRRSGLRLFVVCVPLAWVAAGPLMDWVVAVVGKAPTMWTRPLLAGVIGLYPLAFFALAALHRRNRHRSGVTFRIDDVAIRRRERVDRWRNLRAVAVEPNRVRLLSARGRVLDVTLPTDATIAASVVEFIVARVPAYDTAVHGPLDLPSAVPARFKATLVVASAAAIAAGAVVVRPIRAGEIVFLWTLVASVTVGACWYAWVRRSLNRPQRDAAQALALGSMLLAPMLVVAGWFAPQMLRTIEDWHAIPVEQRERMSRTVVSRPGR